MKISVDAIRDCLDGDIPAAFATCAADGTPNVSVVSHVQFVNADHVALSFQFFNKSRENILANPHATVVVVDPRTGAQYRLAIQYLRTETEGPLFELMKARLAGIASHTGMAGVFRLLGSDVYRVLDVDPVPGRERAPVARSNLLARLREVSERIAASTELAGLLDETLAALESACDIRHAMILMADTQSRRLYTVASRGYPESGVGAEIPFGQGVIGVAAEQRTPIRITHMTAEYSYVRAIRDSAEAQGLGTMLETEIPLPGLPESRSRLAVPVVSGRRLVGVLYAESDEDRRFGYDDEDLLVALATQLALAIHVLQQSAEAPDPAPAPASKRAPLAGPPAAVRHFCANDSVFIDEDYVIKGVAGAILWKLVRDYVREKRTEFSNRELRLDPTIRLPDITDNLEARLILLQRRLSERCPYLGIEKTGRGRFRLRVDRPLKLTEDVPAG